MPNQPRTPENKMGRKPKNTETGMAPEDSGHPKDDFAPKAAEVPESPPIPTPAEVPNGRILPTDLADRSDIIAAGVEPNDAGALGKLQADLSKQVADLQYELQRANELHARTADDLRETKERYEQHLRDARDEGRLAGRQEQEQWGREDRNREAYRSNADADQKHRRLRGVSKYVGTPTGGRMVSAVAAKLEISEATARTIVAGAFEGDETLRRVVVGAWGAIDFDQVAAQNEEGAELPSSGPQPFRTGADEFQSAAHRQQLADRGLTSKDVPAPNPPSGDAPEDYGHKNESAALPGQPIGPLTKPEK